MPKKIIFSILVLLVLVSCQTAQGPATQDQPKGAKEGEAPPEKKSEPAPRQVDVSELVIGVTEFNVRFDPARAFTSTDAQIYTAIYEGLFSSHPVNLRPVPALASDWNISDDYLAYTFTLRDNAYYSNGDKVTPEHIKDSLIRTLEPTQKSEFGSFLDIITGARDYRLGKITDKSKVGITVESGKLIIKLEAPAAHLLWLLYHMSFVNIHPMYLNSTENWNAEGPTVTCGPYFITENNADKIVLEKNKYYWDADNVQIPKIVINKYADSIKVTEAFNRGTVNWALDWDYGTVEDRSCLVANPIFATHFLYFKADREPWSDPRVTRAMALLMPWAEIRSKENNYLPTDRLVPQLSSFPDVNTIKEQNAKEALKLLDEAGFPKGKGLPPVKFLLGGGDNSVRLAAQITEAWKRYLTVEVQVEQVGYPQYYQRVKDGDYTIGQMTWIGDFADPLAFLQLFASDSSLNDSGYHNAEFDSLLRKGAALTGDERLSVFAQAESLLLTQGVVLPINHRATINLIDHRNILGWVPNPMDLHPFKYMFFKEARVFPNII